MNGRFAFCIVLGVGITGCTVGPKYTPPKVASAPAFAPQPKDVTSPTFGGAVDPAWWNSFRDPELSSLVTRLARQNLDLKRAAERVEQARDEKRVVRSAGLPQVGANASYTRTKQSPNGFLELITPAPGAPLVYNFFADSLTASWDLDLFGRVRREVEAAEANTQVSIEVQRGLAIAAVADLAQDYIQLRGVQAREAILRGGLALADRSLALTHDQFNNGTATNQDVAGAQARRAIAASLLPAVEIEKASLINAMGLLLAEQPRALEGELRTAAPQPPLPPSVPVGLPSELVRRRPDVREAEANLHAATAEIGVAIASLYPDITLSGEAGFQGLQPQNLISSPSRYYNVGPVLNLPLFEGGRLRGTVALRKSEQRDAALSFQRTVLVAWREADDAMTAYAQAQRQHAEVFTAFQQNQIALASTRQAYAEGAVDALSIVTAEASLLQSQNALVDADTQLNTDLVTLYRALGGGWETLEAIR